MSQNVIIYGSGGIGRSILPKVKEKYPKCDILFTDGNSELWGSKIDRLEVINPEAIKDRYPCVVVIATAQGYKNVYRKLKDEFHIEETNIDDSYAKRIYEQTFAVRDEFLFAFSTIANTNGLSGNCAEGGVFEGDFAEKINRAFPNRKLYLFDTFSGFDERDLAQEDGYTSTRKKGFDLSITEDFILSRMAYPNNVILKKGFFPETADGIEDDFVFVNLDFDLYAPTLEGLKFFYPKMKKGGIILVHDYFSFGIEKQYSFGKVKNAVDEFCEQEAISFMPIGDMLSVAVIKN